MPAISATRPSVERFMTSFLAALYLAGKREIWIRTDRARIERRRMHALSEYLESKVEESDKDDIEWRRFIVNLRNTCLPSPIGSFEGFIHQLRLKMITIISLDWPDCEYYEIELCKTSARSILERETDPAMRQLVEGAIAAYMSVLER